jgi:hypothetical protein
MQLLVAKVGRGALLWRCELTRDQALEQAKAFARECRAIRAAGHWNHCGLTWFIRNVISNADYIWLSGARDLPGRRDRGGVVPFRAGFRSTMLRPGTGFT